jgi:predicted ferric reductase
MEGRGMNELLWWIGRTGGLVAYLALWGAMFFGVLLGSRGGGGLLHSPTLTALHRAWSFAAVAVTAVHVVAVVASPASPVPVSAAVVPFVSPAQRGAVALGTLATWALLLLVGTSLARTRPAPSVWRAVHALSAAGYFLAVAHAVYAGPDADAPAVRAFYVATGAALVGAIAQRVALATARA